MQVFKKTRGPRPLKQIFLIPSYFISSEILKLLPKVYLLTVIHSKGFVKPEPIAPAINDDAKFI